MSESQKCFISPWCGGRTKLEIWTTHGNDWKGCAHSEYEIECLDQQNEIVRRVIQEGGIKDVMIESGLGNEQYWVEKEIKQTFGTTVSVSKLNIAQTKMMLTQIAGQ